MITLLIVSLLQEFESKWVSTGRKSVCTDRIINEWYLYFFLKDDLLAFLNFFHFLVCFIECYFYECFSAVMVV